ncbi:MAG TPA: methyl-accepting chemotaxis protein [Aromatoleum sp.]|uniref:HAMP domain-containing methyl-accepting chemotaxis protein n=1 Tax=Aromatoleum sp. TaxID=2307007 RepID=UPI002B482AF9|nr:methyl-accepting chemotaxis protein [Aromatoleum sp.]HJV26818.1 methyl-accepting chemotaxis protein [Aromatoleum sp.]
MQRQFADLSLAKKLACGFGLVLLLTGMVAAIAVSTMQAADRRFDLLKQMSQISDAALRVRVDERSFSLTGDAASADAVRAGLDAILASSEALRARSPANAAAMDEVDAAVHGYREAFDQFVDLSQKKDLALESAAWSVQNVTGTLDLVRGQFMEDGLAELKASHGRDGARLVGQAGELGEVARLALQAINEARVRLEHSRKADASAGDDAMTIPQTDEALAVIAKLLDAAGSDPAYRGVLVEAKSHLGGFADRLKEYTGLLAEERKVHAQMRTRADDVLRQVDQAYGQQAYAMRDHLTASSGFILASSAAALLVGLGAAALITRVVVRRLGNAIRVADRIADGDLTEKIDVRGADEVGQLMRAMERMSSALGGIVGGLQSGIGRIADSAQSLSVAAERSNSEVSSQKAETEQVATAMNEMATTVHEVARSAEDAASAAESADAAVRSGRQVVKESIGRIEQLASAATSASDSMGVLHGEVQNIGAVLDVIKGLAEQTNLLALNAAIEAARAGEQGRGFAVVADEVRLLAQRTQKSTVEIEDLVRALLRSAQDSVRQITISSELVRLSVDDVGETEGALHSIAEAVAVIHRLNQQIAAAAEQQSSVAAEVNRSMESIRSSADQAAATMEGTAASSVELAQLSNELHVMVGRFRL